MHRIKEEDRNLFGPYTPYIYKTSCWLRVYVINKVKFWDFRSKRLETSCKKVHYNLTTFCQKKVSGHLQESFAFKSRTFYWTFDTIKCTWQKSLISKSSDNIEKFHFFRTSWTDMNSRKFPARMARVATLIHPLPQ